MLNQKIEKGLVDQMNYEIYSAFIYKAMGAYLDSIDLAGMANWMKVQYEEEMFHAEKMYSFIVEREGRAFFTAFPPLPVEWDSIKAVFEGALEHERTVTSRINNLMTLALEEKDHATHSFLNWFVNEQVEEEANVITILKQLKLMGDSGHGLYMLDKELAARIFVPPVDSANTTN